MNTKFNFENEPGQKIDRWNYEPKSPVISVIVPFYNDEKYITQTVNCLLNQTFPCFELLIIDDGSTDELSLKKLDEIEQMDGRIKIFHKNNEGLAATRDYGASKAFKETKYLMFLDSDDLIDKTFLECGYWTLETNKDAAWAYADSIGFDCTNYTWNKWFDSEKMKTTNDLVSAAIIRKKDFWEVNGYELREKSVNEDWNFWLKLIAKGKYPVHMSYYGLWYRRKKQGELAKATQNKERSLEIINKTASTITKKVEAIQYPIYNYNYERIEEKNEEIIVPQLGKNDKKNILMIFPWMVLGGADRFNLELVSRLDKSKFNVIIITTEPAPYILRQKFEENAIVYDLTSFLNVKDWLSFMNYIIEKEQISLIFNTNSELGYSMLPYIKSQNPNIPILDYVHMEEWYWRNGGYSRDSAAFEQVIDKTCICNENSRKILIEHFGKKAEETETVYIGVDEKKFNPEKYNKQEILRELNISNAEGKYILNYICRIAEQKRPHLLIKIIQKLKTQRNDFIVIVAGDGPMLKEIQNESAKLNLTENIVFLGTVKETEKIYKISDLSINCSIKEGLALTAYESLAMGVPVVTADVGGQRELVDETVGSIVPCMQQETEIFNFNYKEEEIDSYVEAINKILNNLPEYKKNSRLKILNGFTIDNMVEKMSDIFQNAVQNQNQEKLENGKALSRNINLTKELITKYLINGKEEYNWRSLEFTQNNIHVNNKFNKSKIGYEHTLEYKIKHPFVVALRKIGVYDTFKSNVLDKIREVY